jgi:dihydrofolate synthase/folylpolyglutamate synthase
VSATLSYPEALAAMTARGRFGIRLGLGRTRAILGLLGDPQRSFRGALVAGTNGKGSVLALAGSALTAAGVRTGQTPKPHLVSYRERLQVGGHPVDAATFARLVSEVLPVADRVSRRLGDPTEFEILTAVVFLWFAEQGIDVAVVEVGLGGRLDATHAWDGGVAVITNVDLDHMDRLGPTVTAIAREKAAIIERGDLAVTGASGDGLAVIRRRARRMGTPLTEAPPAPLLGWDRDTIRVALPGLGPTDVGLRGRHQAANVAVADALLDALGAAGIATVGAEGRRLGYRTARWPGRLELLEAQAGAGPREVLLDGAHNPAGARALAQALDDLRPYLAGGAETTPPPLTLVMAMMADKDVAGTVAALDTAVSLRTAHVICTQVEGERAMPADTLARIWRDLTSAAGLPNRVITALPDPGAALGLALEPGPTATPGPVIVAGSLYLVGAIRGKLVDDPLLREPVEDMAS